MDKRLCYYRAASLEEAAAAECSLNVIIGTDACSLMVWHEAQGLQALVAWMIEPPGNSFAAVESDIRQVFGQEPMWRWQYKQVKCGLSNAQVTLVPRRLFQPRDLPAYFQLLLPSESGTIEYGYDKLMDQECFAPYIVDTPLKNMLEGYFPGATTFHLASALLSQWNRYADPGTHQVWANMRNKSLQIAVFDRRNLLLFNTYTFEHANDLLYNVLLVYDQFRLSPNDVGLHLSGNLTSNSEIHRLLSRFVRNIHFMPPADGFALPENFRDLPAHYFFDLQAVRHFTP